ncbi:hypothetical protein V2G26_019759 [Clonostachys chloroleuca]
MWLPGLLFRFIHCQSFQVAFRLPSLGPFLLSLSSIFRPSASLEQLLGALSLGILLFLHNSILKAAFRLACLSFSSLPSASLFLAFLSLPLSIIIERLLGMLSYTLSFYHLIALWKQLSGSFPLGVSHLPDASFQLEGGLFSNVFLYRSVDWIFSLASLGYFLHPSSHSSPVSPALLCIVDLFQRLSLAWYRSRL